MTKWKGILTEKSCGVDFDPLDFEPEDFETEGKGWKGELNEK